MNFFQQARLKNIILPFEMGMILGLSILFSISCSPRKQFHKRGELWFSQEIYLLQDDLIFTYDTLWDAEDYLDRDWEEEELDNQVYCSKQKWRSLKHQQLIAFEKAIAQHYWKSDSGVSASQLIQLFDNMEVLTGYVIGNGASRSGNYALFQLLLKKASNEELLTMTKAENPVTRCYAFWALTKRKTSHLFPTLCAHLSDTTEFVFQYGCVRRHQRVGDFFIEKALKDEYPSKSGYTLYKTRTWLTKAEKRKLDSLVLADTTSKITYRREVINRAGISEEDF